MNDARAAKALIIDVAMPCPAWRRRIRGVIGLARETAAAVLTDAGVADAEVSLVLGDDAVVRTLNRRWRRKDAPTNVLSFPTGERRMLGDVVLAFETVVREAKEQGKPLAHHLRHLIVHGVLHLLGYDHERERDAARMENRERRILRRFDVPDPYSITSAHG
jgi:probable rRNA maturation factor